MQKKTQGRLRASVDNMALYKFYKDNWTDTVPYTIYANILKMMNTKICELLFEGFTFVPCARLGRFHVSQRKTRIPTDEEGNLIPFAPFINHGATNKLWKEHPEYKGVVRIFHDNEHFNGNKVNVSWTKVGTKSTGKAGVVGISKYNFKPCRAFKRGLAKYIFAHPNVSYYTFNRNKTKTRNYDK